MDVDALFMEEWGRLMKKGKCFPCKKSGHLPKVCPKKDSQDDRNNEKLKKKWEGKKLHSFIQNIYQDIESGEKEESIKQAKEAGFWNEELNQHQFLPYLISTL